MQICLLTLITNHKMLSDKRINIPVYDIASQWILLTWQILFWRKNR